MKYLLAAAALLALSGTEAGAANCAADQVQYEDTCEPKPPPMGPRTTSPTPKQPCSVAVDRLGFCGTNNDRILPPPAYNKPFAGRLIENTALDMDDFAEVCSLHPQAAMALGCAIRFVPLRSSSAQF
jgi:hypothetical protein